jgi:hypothetical protein
VGIVGVGVAAPARLAERGSKMTAQQVQQPVRHPGGPAARGAQRREARRHRSTGSQLHGFQPTYQMSFARGSLSADPRFAWPSPRFWQFVGATVVGASFFLLWIVVLIVLR